MRLVIASAMGGVYSFIVLADDIGEWLLMLSRIVACLIIVAVAFPVRRLRRYLITAGIFLFSSYLMLGIVVGLHFLTGSDGIVVHNSTVYFDIGAVSLVLSAALAYAVSAVVVRVHSRILSSREIYTLTVTNSGVVVNFAAMLDTGNHLREPFSNMPVIVVDSARAEPLVGGATIRLVPVSTVSGSALLRAFRPDGIVLRSSAGRESVENAYIALSDDVGSDTYSAILNPEILSV